MVSCRHVTRPFSTVRVSSGQTAMLDSKARAPTGSRYFAILTLVRRRSLRGATATQSAASGSTGFARASAARPAGSVVVRAGVLGIDRHCMGSGRTPVNQPRVTECSCRAVRGSDLACRLAFAHPGRSYTPVVILPVGCCVPRTSSPWSYPSRGRRRSGHALTRSRLAQSRLTGHVTSRSCPSHGHAQGLGMPDPVAAQVLHAAFRHDRARILPPRRVTQAGICSFCSASSSSWKLGMNSLGTILRPVSTLTCGALPCRWATSTALVTSL